jgi:Trypsin-like peptidase domain
MAKGFATKLVCLILIAAGVVAAQSVPPRKDIPAIAKSANGAIVTIVMANNDKPIARGTGFLVRPDGVIVTNYHVIETGNVAVVKFADGTISPVDGVLATDKVRDLAIIKIHGKTFRTLTLGNSDQIQVGEEVVAIGNPLGLELTVSNGILSGVRTNEEAGGKFLQVTAPITHGSSGGPLFNMTGEVVGITTLGFEGSGDLNFAIPINDAKRLLSNKFAKLQNLPDEPLNDDAERSKPVVPETPQEQRWLSSERYDRRDFSALYPRRQLSDRDVDCTKKVYDSGGSGIVCIGQTEDGNVTAGIIYSDFAFEPERISLNKALDDEIHRLIPVNPIQLSNSAALINQDQSFTALKPVAAKEATAKGFVSGIPVKLCARVGTQGQRLWTLVVLFADSTGHTQKECDAFFDSIVVK